ncbi:hypothetical protein DM01DRAFT_1299138 [Hesseltinella vesiculosa]|uniref:Uncharacterized protein n=1 Tax=Hesseltinella vesiculosa TaxID=101127 RepID=A0A1X2GWN8_9FUNG|nr:hypothetical protein DM01DRAFT_1299138 [Hesseltinella vesiculosa]
MAASLFPFPTFFIPNEFMNQPQKILVANRGEIAIRVLTAASQLGYQTVAVYSAQDTSHCAHADQSVQLSSAASFLNVQHIIDIAKSVEATMIHPGYGFLSESDQLSRQCAQNNIRFIGPSPECILAVGDKVSARQQAQAAGVSVIPGTASSLESTDQIHAFAAKHGYPIMLKARDGGGGRGIRLVHQPDQVNQAFQRCMNESPSKQVFLEKAIVDAKHIEVQIVADHHGHVLHLLERDCSIQRRYQKVLEIAPSFLPDALRTSIHQAALKLARHISYNSVGTVEFLVTQDQFYFLEINPRIQVEHTVTEQITQIDLVQTQILIALGQHLPQLIPSQDAIYQFAQSSRLVAIQARVVAESPSNNHMLSVGQITHASFPTTSTFGLRVDTWIQPGTSVHPTFDSLLAKIIVTGRSLDDALAKIAHALKNTIITGVDTNLDFLTALVLDRDYLTPDLHLSHTHALESSMERLIQASLPWTQRRQALTQHLWQNEIHGTAPTNTLMQFKPGDAFNVTLTNDNNRRSAHTFQIDTIQTNRFPDEFSGHVQSTLPDHPAFSLTLARRAATGSGLRSKANPQDPGHVGAPLTGMLVEINVQQGDLVQPGQQLFVITAMKMETVVKSPIHGCVSDIAAHPNDLVDAADLVISLAGTNNSKL